MDQALKRKAESSPLPRPIPKRSGAAQPFMKGEDYIRSTMNVPKPSEYSGIPRSLFINPKEGIHNFIRGHPGSQINTDFLKLDREGYRCELTFQMPDQEPLQIVDGEGLKKKTAERAAFLHLLAKLHDLGALQKMFTTIEVDRLDQQILADEADAKMDIYNYAARFDAVPKVDLRVVQRSRRTGGRKIIEVTAELSELDIQVVGRGTTVKAAEVAAALHFREAAEKHHAEHGDGSITIKNPTSLTTSNARNFLEYYRTVYPKASVEITGDQVGDAKLLGVRRNKCQVVIDTNPIGESVEMTGKKKAEELAYLTAAIALKKRQPELYPKFLDALKAGNGEILRPIKPIDLAVDDDAVLVMRETLLRVRRAGLPDQVEEMLSDEEVPQKRQRFRHQLAEQQIEPRNAQLQQAFHEYLKNPRLEELRRKRSELPMNQYNAKVLNQVNYNTYSIIVGATGSGKTTQVPQILLEDAISHGQGATCNIICTQPRRIAATSVARRVAEERAERLQDTVGYHVRFDAKLPNPGGSINYCTTGILLQQLQHSPDEVMDGASHLIIDEVHERDILIDFLLIILKKVMAHRMASGKPIPKVVLMSATMDTDLFASYFNNNLVGQGTTACPALSVPGRTFPVKEKFLDTILEEMDKTHSPQDLQIMRSDTATRDYLDINARFNREYAEDVKPTAGQKSDISQDNDFIIDWKHERKLSAQGEVDISNEKEDGVIPYALIATTIAHIAKTTRHGAILVFLPGLDELLKVDDWLRQCPLGVNFTDEARFKLSMLHSSITGGHTEVFNAVPEGCRKVILATNIAETSITIPDVQHVVDAGKLREKQYDQLRRITSLKCTWISKSNSKQRAGRAGRVQDGNYYALFSRARHNSLRAIGLPEMLRSDLQEICLDIKAQAFKSPIRQFLSEAIEPPAPAAVDTSVTNLQALDALTDDEKITPLGRLLASLPVHPSLGKMIILGVLFRCLDPMIILGAAAAERNIFIQPLEARREAQDTKARFAQSSASDHMALLNAVRDLRHLRNTHSEYAARDFAFKNFIHLNACKTIENTAQQILDILVEAGIIPMSQSSSRQSFEYGDPSLNTNSSKTPLIKALALAGLHPNLAVSTGGRSFRTPGEKGTIVHPSSVNAPRAEANQEDRVCYGTLYSYGTMARSNDGGTMFLRETTESTPLMASLFGGKLAPSSTSSNVLEMDKWLPFYIRSYDRRALKTVLEFRKALERLLAGAFKDLKVRRESSRHNSDLDRGERKAYLADEKVREMFAEGLVEVLEKDVGGPKGGRKGGDSWRPGNGRKWKWTSDEGSAGGEKEKERDRSVGW